jgi:hypothetical protein
VRHAVLLTLLGLLAIAAGFRSGGWGALLVWLGLDFLLLGLAHLRGDHRVFGKRPDGTLPWWSWLVFLPLLAYTAAAWHLVRLLSREARVNRVSDQLVVGRRLLSDEVAPGFVSYVDLTSELQEPRGARQAPGYRAFPILDASAPDPEALRAAVAGLPPGPVFVHCAQGHGRTGLFALAVLLSSGAVRDVEEGLALLAGVRPAIRLSTVQLRCIRTFGERIGGPPGP